MKEKFIKIYLEPDREEKLSYSEIALRLGLNYTTFTSRVQKRCIDDEDLYKPSALNKYRGVILNHKTAGNEEYRALDDTIVRNENLKN